MTGTSNTVTDEAHAAVWRRMLAVVKHLRDQKPLPLSEGSLIVQMRQGSGCVPVYWIDPDLDEFKIGQSITANIPIYAVEIRRPSLWFDSATGNETKGLPTVEQIVEPCVAAIKAHTHFSRCILCGHSFAGVIAFEAARQLAPLGIEVETILVFDTVLFTPSSHGAAWQKLKEIWFPASNTPISIPMVGRLKSSLWIMRWLLGFKWKGLTDLIVNALARPAGPAEGLTTKLDDMGKPIAWPKLKFVYDNAMNSYRVSPLDGSGVLFRAESRQDVTAYAEPQLGWTGLFRKGLKTVSVPGDHWSMLWQPHAKVLAREISLILSGTLAEQEEREAGPASEQRSEPRIG
jgi:thioesterase domain-containing protein